MIALTGAAAVAGVAASLVALLTILVLVGHAGSYLTPEGDRLARVSPGGGFWLMLFAFALLAADAMTRLRPPPLLRIAVLATVAAAIAVIL